MAEVWKTSVDLVAKIQRLDWIWATGSRKYPCREPLPYKNDETGVGGGLIVPFSG